MKSSDFKLPTQVADKQSRGWVGQYIRLNSKTNLEENVRLPTNTQIHKI